MTYNTNQLICNVLTGSLRPCFTISEMISQVKQTEQAITLRVLRNVFLFLKKHIVYLLNSFIIYFARDSYEEDMINHRS